MTSTLRGLFLAAGSRDRGSARSRGELSGRELDPAVGSAPSARGGWTAHQRTQRWDARQRARFWLGGGGLGRATSRQMETRLDAETHAAPIARGMAMTPVAAPGGVTRRRSVSSGGWAASAGPKNAVSSHRRKKSKKQRGNGPTSVSCVRVAKASQRTTRPTPNPTDYHVRPCRDLPPHNLQDANALSPPTRAHRKPPCSSQTRVARGELAFPEARSGLSSPAASRRPKRPARPFGEGRASDQVKATASLRPPTADDARSRMSPTLPTTARGVRVATLTDVPAGGTSRE